MDIARARQHIIRNTENDAPKTAAILSRHEAVAEQYRLITNWKPKSDVWPLTAGRGFLIVAASLTGIYINKRFRANIKLRSYGLVPTMLGLTVIPAATTSFSHREFIVNKLLLLEIPCPLCLESRSALIQICNGLLLPLIMTPLANFSIAVGSGVYNVPYITDVKGIFRIVFSAYQPLVPKLTAILTCHALLAGFMTYLEIRSLLRVLDIQYLKEQEEKERIK